MSFVYANTGSGPNAGGIGWFDFGSGFTATPGELFTNLTGTLKNGIKVKFDMKYNYVTGTATDLTAVTAPAAANSYFGSASGGYTGLNSNNVVLQTVPTSTNTTMEVIISGIVVTDAKGNNMPNYTCVIADGQNTSGTASDQESLTYVSNGGAFSELTRLGSTNIPILSMNASIASITGFTAAPNAAYVLTTASPNNVQLIMQMPLAGLQQGIAIGFAVTQLEVYKVINGRISTSDQFTLNIGGSSSASTTTTGTANGLQPIYSSLSAIPTNAYTINEAMAAGSSSALTKYTQTITAVNLTPGGTTPATGTLPINITPALGDIIQYTITNIPSPVVTKTVTPSFAQPGDLLKYTVSVFNPNSITAMSNTLVTDLTPAGTSYAGKLAVSVPYTGTTPATGITLTNIPALGTATISWSAQVIDVLPAVNPIPNFATATLSGGSTMNTNRVTTQINKADLTASGNFIKTADPVYASPGDTVTYTISITNTGNVQADKVVITDPIPAGTTYVPGSITGTIPFTGTPDTGLALTGPILAGTTVTYTFRVVLGNSVPAVNPVPNTASVAYSYTVDPSFPNNAKGFGNSNTTTVAVSTVILTMNKTADKFVAYMNDIITYSLSVTNSGNVSANNVIITDVLPYGLTYIPGSLVSSVPITGDPTTVISLLIPITAGQTVNLIFKATVTAIPNPNPLGNMANAAFTYTVNPASPNGVVDSSASNTALTSVFMNNYSQQISDLVNSVAMGEAALGAIANSEGAKIQRFASMPGVTPQTLLCLNKSITDMANSMATLESILLQKLSSGECQITGGSNC